MGSMEPGWIRLGQMDAAWATEGAGARLAAVRQAAPRLKQALVASGTVQAVGTFDVSDLLYPAAYGLSGAVRGLTGNVVIRNRMQVVQTRLDGRLITVLINPTEPHRSKMVPFVRALVSRYGAALTRMLERQLIHSTVAERLERAGIAPDQVDYILFDHHHTQDVRGLLGTDHPEPGEQAPTPAGLPRAKLVIQRAEYDACMGLHPHQRHWYVEGGLHGVPADRLCIVDGDILLGEGLAVVRTPGHTQGNQSAVLHTDGGIWTISENGIAAEAYAPEHSKMSALRAFAAERQLEVVLNGNTREDSLQQYTSMVLEKLLADPSPVDPRFPQHFPSSELVASVLAPGIRPSFSHTAITQGTLQGPGAVHA